MGIYDTIKDVTNLVKQIDNKELYGKILDLQNQASGLLEKVRKKEKIIKKKENEINELKEQLKIKENLEYDGKVYRLENNNSEFYCPRCWEVDNNLVHLKTYLDKGKFINGRCLECDIIYKKIDSTEF